MKLTKPQKQALERIKEFPIISDKKGGVSPHEWRKYPFRCRAAPDRQGRYRSGTRRLVGRLHANLCGIAMMPQKKTLVITYKSGRTERVKFETPNEAQKNKDKLLKFESVTSVEAVA